MAVGDDEVDEKDFSFLYSCHASVEIYITVMGTYVTPWDPMRARITPVRATFSPIVPIEDEEDLGIFSLSALPPSRSRYRDQEPGRVGRSNELKPREGCT